MGTSQSSSGSPSGGPLVPGWVDDEAEVEVSNGDEGAEEGGPATDSAPTDADLSEPESSPPGVLAAPPGRFGPARRSLGSFVRTGSGHEMRRGIGRYVRRGLGGSATATERLSGTTRTAGALFGALAPISSGEGAARSPSLSPELLEGRSADEIMDAVVEAVRPIDGTQDTEASRHAINDALSDLLTRYPEADLLNLSDEQRFLAIEGYVAIDVFNRFDLDVGKHLRSKAPSVAAELSRLREVKTYIRETIAAAFRTARAKTRVLSPRVVTRLVRTALQEALEVFEEYVS